MTFFVVFPFTQVMVLETGGNVVVVVVNVGDVVVGADAHWTGNVAGDEVPDALTATTLSDAWLFEIEIVELVNVHEALETVIVVAAPPLHT